MPRRISEEGRGEVTNGGRGRAGRVEAHACLLFEDLGGGKAGGSQPGGEVEEVLFGIVGAERFSPEGEGLFDLPPFGEESGDQVIGLPETGVFADELLAEIDREARLSGPGEGSAKLQEGRVSSRGNSTRYSFFRFSKS